MENFRKTLLFKKYKKICSEKKNKPFFIAEISSNHNGLIRNAIDLIRHAKLYGADAVKLQTYEPNTMTIKSNKKFFKINEGLWKGHSL